MTKALGIGPKQTHILSNFSHYGKCYDEAAVYLIMLRMDITKLTFKIRILHSISYKKKWIEFSL